MSATIIVDALWGDSGKGKASAYIARRIDASLAVSAGIGTNAGASVVLEDDTVIRARQLPTAWLNKNTEVGVGSGVLVDPTVFLDEIDRFDIGDRAYVDSRCAVITKEHIRKEIEDQHLNKKIGSTLTGNGYARSDFVLRTATQAKDVPELQPYVTDVALKINEASARSHTIVQGSQGTMLSLALSTDYPYTTSDNCTSAAAIDDVGLNWQLVGQVLMIVKAMPSRVGAGPLPHEMELIDIEKRGIEERGVVTGRPRRKADRPDLDMLKYSSMLNGPTGIILTFCDHYDPDIMAVSSRDGITSPLKKLIADVERATGAPVIMIDNGKRLDDIIEIAEIPELFNQYSYRGVNIGASH